MLPSRRNQHRLLGEGCRSLCSGLESDRAASSPKSTILRGSPLDRGTPLVCRLDIGSLTSTPLAAEEHSLRCTLGRTTILVQRGRGPERDPYRRTRPQFPALSRLPAAAPCAAPLQRRRQLAGFSLPPPQCNQKLWHRLTIRDGKPYETCRNLPDVLPDSEVLFHDPTGVYSGWSETLVPYLDSLVKIAQTLSKFCVIV